MATSKSPGPKPEFYEVEGNFHGRITGADEELVMPLKVPYRLFKQLMDISEDNPLDDLEEFIEQLNLGDAAKVLDEADDAIQVLAYATAYFERFNELAEARLGIQGLVEQLSLHEAAAARDFRGLGLSLLDVGVCCSWGEALLLAESLSSDPTSHLGAALAEWQWPASVPELAMTLLAQGVLSYLAPQGKSVAFPMPWDETPEREAIDPVVVDEMRTRMEQYSAFAD